MSQKLFLYVFFTINMCERRFVNVSFVFLSVKDVFVPKTGHNKVLFK